MAHSPRFRGGERPPPYHYENLLPQAPHVDGQSSQWRSIIASTPQLDHLTHAQALYQSAIQSVLDPKVDSRTITEGQRAPKHSSQERRPRKVTFAQSCDPESRSATMSSPRSSSTPSLPSDFARQPLFRKSLHSFTPMIAISNGITLSDGFHMGLPEPIEYTKSHPFKARDVLKEEWYCFLSGLATAIGNAPTPVNADEGLREGECHQARNVIDFWNKRFFCPRRIKVYLARGPDIIAGSSKAGQIESPDWALLSKMLAKDVILQTMIPSILERFRLVVVSL